MLESVLFFLPMWLPILLICIPAVFAFGFLACRSDKLRLVLVASAATGLVIGCAGLLGFNYHRSIQYLDIHNHYISLVMLVLECLLGAYIFYRGLTSRRPLVCILVVLQTVLMAGFELGYAKNIIVAHDLFIDRLSIVMALIVGVIGSIIAVYSLGYMGDFHKHFRKEVKDNSRFFFFLIFIFIFAMFGIIFSNNLLWLYFFWEVTTLCSFLLIGYKNNPESRTNALRALEFNLIGGLAFALGIVYLYITQNIIELDKLMNLDKSAAIVPVILLAIAGLTKSAQLPFSKWLLGAMVAPTPVSALLHSSTMVKAGVYIIVRFASVLQGSLAGFMFAAIGGITFIVASFIAVSHNDAKKILAYSTIANLGLIVLCAGIGTYEAIWAAVLLIIFHAIAKCLLFLCVGVIEHKIHSRDIEQMSGLIISMPKISIMVQIGIAGMFLAPFGMLISKWAVLKALVDYNPLFIVFVIFGGSATLFFWVKWLGRLITVTQDYEYLEDKVSKSEWVALSVLSVLTVGICAFFAQAAKILIEPYIQEIYNTSVTMSEGNLIIMSIMLAMVLLFPLSFINYGKKVKVVDAYLGGANTQEGTEFYAPAGNIQPMQMKSYYFERYFGEKKLFGISAAICIILLFCAILSVLL